MKELCKKMAFCQYRYFSNGCAKYAKNVAKNLKGKSKSSQEWLVRQLSDPYIDKAKMLNYRCRSAFKLLEIDDKYKILKPGDIVLDCGAAPGSWSQVAVERTNADGKSKGNQKQGAVFSIDLLHLHAIEGATIFGGMNFMHETSQNLLKKALDGHPVNCVISDMAPNATGVRILDQENITQLCYSVFRFAALMSSPGAHLLMKAWDNANVPTLEKDLSRFYENVRRIKPKASRSDSAECFILARDFKGLERK